MQYLKAWLDTYTAMSDESGRIAELVHRMRADIEGLLTIQQSVKSLPGDPESQDSQDDVETQSLHSSLSPDEKPPRVFVSWAHSGETWSDAQTATWVSAVVDFTVKLRSFGIDADLDLFHTSESNVDWTRFGPRGVTESEFVVIVLSEAWAQRWTGTNRASVGAGAVAEADALHGLFQQNQSEWQRRVLLVLLPGVDNANLPADLARVNRFYVDPGDPDSFDGLLRTLTEQPLYVLPELGRVPVLPPAVTTSLEGTRGAGDSAEYGNYRALLKKVRGSKGRRPQAATSDQQRVLLQAILDAIND